MQKTILAFMLLFVFFTSFAQKRKEPYPFLTVSPDLLIPNAEFAETHSIGFGFSVSGGYKLNRYFAPVLSYNYYSVPSQDKSVNANLAAHIVKAGGRFYLQDFYLVTDAGAAFTNGYDNATRFIYSVGAGDEIRLGKRSRLDVSAAYEGFNTGRNTGIIAVRVGYTYRFFRD
jgi:Outer membrane protein beta-barrel domain